MLYSVNRESKSSEYYLKCLSDYYNRRTILLEHKGDTHQVIDQLKIIADQDDSGKLIAFVPQNEITYFKQQLFIQEGIIPAYFRGKHAYCFSYFRDPERRSSARIVEEDEILKKVRIKSAAENTLPRANQYQVRNASVADVDKLARFMDRHFKTYPTPVHEPDYLKKFLQGENQFKIAYEYNEIIAVASADCNPDLLNAEITDCLTHPHFRGHGLAAHLIALLEKDLHASGYISLYSLARAISPGINRALSRNGYQYGGRLINNCNIMGSTEDMNIWAKTIR